ncbi:MAG: Flp pilus assembly complex ATPase component TadA [Oscillospiraceae bacterium]|jgi:stage III sporulation protein AA|nr:Flp pilus assembly complex ATPase component TadA [Oscillospiraceae bacterium]
MQVKKSFQEKNFFLDVISYLTDELYLSFLKIDDFYKENCQEICLRAGLPAVVHIQNNKTYFLNNDSTLDKKPMSNARIISRNEIEEIFKKICDYSIYAYQKEISEGFVTLRGGHRVGIAGVACITNKEITGFSEILSLNIRISREYENSSVEILKELITDSKKIKGFLIVGEPGSGKTTLLRDIARCLSSGIISEQKKVTIVDERREIAGSFLNKKWSYNIGFSDVLSNIPKSKGMFLAIRSLSPEILICDEISSKEDTYTVIQALNSGANLITSIHAGNFAELTKKEGVEDLLKTGAFKNIVLLKGRENPCKVKKILTVGEKKDDKNFRNNCTHCLYIPDWLPRGFKIIDA